MSRFQPESIARWLDDLDSAAYALRLVCSRGPARRPGLAGRLVLPLLVAAVLALRPNVGI